jgi:hypothetical protein
MVLSAVCFVWAFRTKPAQAQSPPDPATASNDTDAIARGRLELARKALAILNSRSAQGPLANMRVPETYQWSVMMLGAQIYLSMAKDEPRVEDPEVYLAVSKSRPSAERLAAFEAHWKRMKTWEDRLLPVARQSVLPEFDFMVVQSHRLQAELWLARERERTKLLEEPPPKR